jgi:hypothetical protein
MAAERREPHLPVEARLMGRDESRPLPDLARFVRESVGLPGRAVATAFDDDFASLGGHDREQPVAVEGANRGQPRVERGHGAQNTWTDVRAGQHLRQRNRNEEDGDQCRGSAMPGFEPILVPVQDDCGRGLGG